MIGRGNHKFLDNPAMILVHLKLFHHVQRKETDIISLGLLYLQIFFRANDSRVKYVSLYDPLVFFMNILLEKINWN